MKTTSLQDYTGVVAAIGIIALWCTSLVLLLTSSPDIVFSVLGVLVQTFLYTGLFITAHDAMHGTVAPTSRRVNDMLGAACVFLYAIFSFSNLKKEHWAHHRDPASGNDPDFHDGEHKSLHAWYLNFMRRYVTWKQVLGMAIVFNILHHVFGISLYNLLTFWALPALLSSLQLFYFGTYLPHREAAAGYGDYHHARSNDYSTFLSFVTCYHFGYHWEHHEYPHIPWWRLPQVRKRAKQSQARP